MTSSISSGSGTGGVPPREYRGLVAATMLLAAYAVYGVVVTTINGHDRFNAYGWMWEIIAGLLIAGSLYITVTVGKTQRPSKTIRDSFTGLFIAIAICSFIAGTSMAAAVWAVVLAVVIYVALSSPLRLTVDDKMGYVRPADTASGDDNPLI